MSQIEIKIPDIGDFDTVEVIEVLVAEGDTIKEEQSLITVESDKASMEIPSSAAGKVVSLAVKVGDKVSEGTVILTLEGAAAGRDAAAKDAGGKGATPVPDASVDVSDKKADRAVQSNDAKAAKTEEQKQQPAAQR